MKKQIILIVFIMINKYNFSQEKNIIDFLQQQIFYDYYICEDSTDVASFKKQEVVLQIGSKYSKFVAVNKLKIDSIIFANSNNKATPQLLNSLQDEVLMYSFSSLIDFDVYKNYPNSGNVLFTGRVDKTDYYIIEEKLQNWEFDKNGDTTILGYKCKRASIAFAGRRYTAWYTKDIAIQDGPYKFSGLPGLILKIQSNCNEHIFIATKIEKTPGNKPLYFIREKNYFSSNQVNYIKAFHNRMQELFAMVVREDNIKFNDNESKTRAMRNANSMNNFIEKY
jgi:GLPGLI family protein